MSAEHCTSPQKVLDALVSLHLSQDDVFSESFLMDTVIIQGDVGDMERLEDIWASLDSTPLAKSWHPTHVLPVKRPNRITPDGPYFLSSGNLLSQAWRVYPDTHDSFTTAVVPSDKDPYHFKPLNSFLSGIWTSVAVPSRLYSKMTPLKPLAGLRFSVKDNLKISGAITTQSNRAWCELYDGKTEDETADYVKTLVDLGAVLVGKTKMCSFASSEEATDQWIDFHAPFNPRGDGYQTPSGSTTGGGTSLAAYEWLDFSIGTDSR